MRFILFFLLYGQGKAKATWKLIRSRVFAGCLSTLNFLKNVPRFQTRSVSLSLKS
jgi:hypothetical protein